MNNLALFFDWYFMELPKKIYQIWLNFLWFFNNYFSLTDLVRTFFYPWKGYYFPYTGGFDPAVWFGNFVFNMFSRFIGMILRFFVIFLGVIVEIFVVISGVLFFLGWFLFPFLLIFCLIRGTQLVI